MKKYSLLFFLVINFWSFFVFGQTKLIVKPLGFELPDSAGIYMAGNFNQWQPKDEKYKLQKQSDGSFSINLPLPTSDWEFKFTLGSWERVETDENGNDISNRIISKSETEAIVQIKKFKKGEKQPHSTASENVQILAEGFDMPQLNRKRRIWIYLPPDYQTNKKKYYPVLYVQDGQNIFDEATSYAGEWGIDKTLNHLYAEDNSNALIVVGIDNGSNLRMNEYAPWKHPKYGGGEGYKYVKFITETLKPYIDKKFRTLKDRENTGILGSSMGGLISFYAGLKYPKVFGKVGVFSPSFWFSKEIFKMAEEYKMRFPSKFYFIAGEHEGGYVVSDTRRMAEVLKSKGLQDNYVRCLIHADGKHSEWYWRREFADAYRFMFKDK
jgi:predicted alpha/beta superfamily hydrolase